MSSVRGPSSGSLQPPPAAPGTYDIAVVQELAGNPALLTAFQREVDLAAGRAQLADVARREPRVPVAGAPVVGVGQPTMPTPSAGA